MALIIDIKWDCDLCLCDYQVCNIFSWSQSSKRISIPIYSKIYQSYVFTNLFWKSMNLILQNNFVRTQFYSIQQTSNCFLYNQTIPGKTLFIFNFMSLVFNDKTFQQADEGTVNVLKYTFGNGVNLVSVQQESLSDYYHESFVDRHRLFLLIDMVHQYFRTF